MFSNLRASAIRITRLSALRQAVVLSLTFLVLLFLAGVFSIIEFERVFENRIEDELRGRFVVVSADVSERGFVASSYPRTGTEYVSVLPESSDVRLGFHEHRPGPDGRLRDNGDWLYLVGQVGDEYLVVGTNLGRREEFLEVILQAMGIVGLGAGLITLCVGVYFGWRSQRRMTRISRTLAAAADGDLNARTGVTRSRDDLDELSHQVDDTIEQLDVLIRQTRDFSANIAHDLKTPLARLRIRLEKALTTEIDEGDSVEEIGSALEQADEVISIFDAFLRIAKLESGTAQAKFEPIALGALLTEIEDTYAPVVEHGGRVLKLELSSPTIINGDRVLLLQLLANLIENAIRYTPDGSDLTLFAEGASIGLADTGPGIPADEYENVIKPSYRLEKSRTQDGAGLGLALVKTIADVHGAALTLSENPESESAGLIVKVDFSKKS
ncbi:Signal transduction histidine kinase [Cognatiyoonia sediminum]|uniref:histidine kinase n=1 Tax=Cognatiyoonia sediminum TaxID=1508389 RepID=A0A1M5QJV0_9RHOB|nr:HAMP domain-containing sensor histidine kinase [Cognatiyoonia sediminum]SHH13843.1 Signal transduction histidine kinase [Cognatiyoonia sediminum]